jgi:diguanylate cyclase
MMTERTREPARSERPQGSIPSGVRDSVTVNVARATIRYLADHGLPPSPDNYLLAWKAVGGPWADAGERSDTTSEPTGASAEDAIRQSDMLRKTQAELLEIVRALCDSIESIAEQDGWLITQVRALRDAVGTGADRRSLAAARAMLETARQSQHDISRSRRDALGALRGLLPDLIAQMTQLGERSGEFGESLTGRLESISQAESIEAIAEEVRHLMADAQSMSQSVEQARGRLEGGARQARELEDQVARLEQELARASELLLTDHLTQAANRTGLEQAFVKAIARLADDEGVMVALLDVDDFKRVNDVMGHFAGDGVLRHLARLLQEQVRGIDTVARYGGEEFVIVMPAMTQADARDCLIKAQRELTRSVYLHEARKVFITFSAGLTAVRAADSLETALARADEGMYRSKRAGKNCVTVV